MVKEKKPGRPKGSKTKTTTPRGRGGKDEDRKKMKACPAIAKAGHGTDWNCSQCNNSGEVEG